MRIHLSSFTGNALIAYVKKFPSARLNILISHGLRGSHYYKPLKGYRENINSIILDSGMFTLNFAKSENLKEKISLEGCIELFRTFEYDIDFAFMYDKCLGVDGLLQNMAHQRRMYEIGLNHVPVIHDHTGEDVEYFVTKGYKIVSFDSSEENMNKIKFIKPHVMKLHAGARVHLLGVTKCRELANAPIAYYDSSLRSRYNA